MATSIQFSAPVASTMIVLVFTLRHILAAHADVKYLSDTYLAFRCAPNEKFAPNGTYQANLARLLSRLPGEVSRTGFAAVSAGNDRQNDEVHVLAQCRGDLGHGDCSKCVVNASRDAPKSCTNAKGAVIWYDACLLKYAPRPFFGQIDLLNRMALTNVMTLTDSLNFVDGVDAFLRGLVVQAANSTARYADGESAVCEYLTLYSFVQCTRDLNGGACRRCLGYAVAALPYVSGLKQGGRVYFGSCEVRYEIYQTVATQM